MSSNNDEPQHAPPSPNRPRRASFAELFASRPSVDTGTTSGQRSSAMSVTLNQQAQDQSRTRRLSITTLGLSGSPTHTQQTSPFGTIKRGKSMSKSDRSGSAIEEADSAIDDDKDCVAPMSPTRGTPPGARRVSFGARAYGSVRAGSISAGVSGLPSAGGMNGNGEACGDAGNGVTPTAARASPPGMRRSGKRVIRLQWLDIALTVYRRRLQLGREHAHAS